MKKQFRAAAVFVAMIFCTGCAAQLAGGGPACKSMADTQKYQQKAENFLIVFDSSETMGGPVGEKPKIAIAKNIISCMNQCIPPDLKLTGGLRTFGHGYYLFSIFQTDLIYGMTNYTQDGLKGALCKIDLASGNTPMVKAINAAAEDLKSVQGRTSLILVTDGKATDGDAVVAAEKLKKAMGDNICIYAIQIGDDFDNKKLLEKVVKAGGCGFLTNADKLADCAAITDFVERALLTKCVHDADKDSVCDQQDACPNTPIGAKVDEHGCWSVVLFDYNQSVIKKSAQPALDEVANVLSSVDNAELKIVIKGYADSTGSERYNEALSHKRAQAVREYLMKRGIKSSRLATKALGSSNPVADNTSAGGRAQNRRVEFSTEP